ncbi:MAG: c-type cytochrome, partial [Loktanella sp.]|nr:c-type cytochrome [Loktanella sp.]
SITLLGVVLAFGTAPIVSAEEAAPLIAQSCAGCHGQAGVGQGASPVLAGYDAEEFVRVWEEFRANERPATIMHRIAPGFTEDEVAELAAYFASLR